MHCAQTSQIKQSTGSCVQRMHNSPECRLYRCLNKAQICCSERTSGTGCCKTARSRSNCTRVTDRYHVLFGNLIPRRKKSGRVLRDSRGNADLYFEPCFQNFKGIVHPKIKILSSFTHPQVVPNLYEFLSSV